MAANPWPASWAGKSASYAELGSIGSFFNELGRADLPVGLDARQRVPTGFMASARDLGIEEAPHEPMEVHGRKASSKGKGGFP